MSTFDQRFIESLLAAQGVSASADEFCKQIVHRVLPNMGTLAALIGKVGDDSKCHLAGKYGPWENVPETAIFDTWDEAPMSRSIRERRPIAVRANEVSRSSLPGLETSDLIVPGAGGYMFIPFDQQPKSIGVLALAFFGHKLEEFEHSLELKMTAVAAEYFSHSGRIANPGFRMSSPVAQQEGAPAPSTAFSNRDLAILRLMADGKTNYAIGRNLNLAESTIKQETVKIFKKLSVSNRNDAWQVAKSLDLI